MPNWGQVLEEINAAQATEGPKAVDTIRKKYLAALAEKTKRTTICYYSGWLTKRIVGTEINDEDKNGFMLCCHGVPKDAGLDLVLHTPGGNVFSTQSIVHYLREIFGDDIRVVVPQIAMSAGTIIACAANSILMGKHSTLGPTDPQLLGIPAHAMKAEFQKAYEQIVANPQATNAWKSILQQVGPTILQQCDWAIQYTEQILREYLSEPNGERTSEQIETIIKTLTDLADNKGHSRHLHHQEAINLGLRIEMLEDDADLQDLVLTVHHCYMLLLANSPCFKIIENHAGQTFLKNQANQNHGISIGLGQPPT